MILTALIRGNSFRVLLADDDEDDRLNFIEAVHEVAPDARVATEPDGARLMDKLHEASTPVPDVLFLDLNMPKKNGFECLDEIRKMTKFESVPVIIYSTSSDPELIDKTYDKGANLYVEKPQSYDEIKTILLKVLSLQREDYWPRPSKSKYFMGSVW